MRFLLSTLGGAGSRAAPMTSRTGPDTKAERRNGPTSPSLRNVSNAVVAASCLIFLLSGLAVIPYPGVQYDEALFAAPLYQPKWSLANVSLFHTHLPIMLMSYLGCLKSWIYTPIFALWVPSVYSLRVPVLLIGTATIYLSWLLLRHILDDRAAIIGAILLATDTSFLLATCFDWGPVALQHLLMVGGVLALVRFHHSGKEWLLGLGFFLFGLGLWDKALFSWMLAGLTVATLVVVPRQLWNDLNWRRLLVAGLFFVLGAFPLLWYNAWQGGSTFRSNAKFSFQDFELKVATLRSTSDGSAFFGYLTAGERPPQLRQPETRVERLSVAVSEFVGQRHRNLTGYAFLLSLLLLPLLWTSPARKLMLFALVFLVVVWAQMAITKGAGTGAHHVILMWPFPIFFIAVTLSQSARWLQRRSTVVVMAAVVALAGANLLVTNQCLKELIQDGPGGVWTDAIFSLTTHLSAQGKTTIYSADWGLTNSLRLLGRGSLQLEEATFILMDEKRNQNEQQFLARMITGEHQLLVEHTTPFEAFAGINARLATAAAGLGYQPRSLAVINDRVGRPVFVVLRMEKFSATGKESN